MTVNVDPVNLTISLTALLIVIIGASWGGVKYLTKKNFDHHFNKNLEKHKSELQNILELNKFDLQRKMHDFSLYTTKKHEIYPRLFKLFLIAEGTAGSLMGLKLVPDYSKMNAKQLEYTLMKNYELPELSIQEYTDQWDEHKDEKIEKLKGFLDRTELQRARHTIIDAKNEFLISRLYVSEEVTEKFEQLSHTLHAYVINVQSISDFPPEQRGTLREEMNKQDAEIKTLISDIKKHIQSELKKGYYDL